MKRSSALLIANYVFIVLFLVAGCGAVFGVVLLSSSTVTADEIVIWTERASASHDYAVKAIEELTQIKAASEATNIRLLWLIVIISFISIGALSLNIARLPAKH